MPDTDMVGLQFVPLAYGIGRVGKYAANAPRQPWIGAECENISVQNA